MSFCWRERFIARKFHSHVKHFQHFLLHSFASFAPSFRIGVAHAVQDTGGRLDILSGCVYIFISSAFVHMYIYIIPRFHLLTRCVIKLLPFHLL